MKVESPQIQRFTYVPEILGGCSNSLGLSIFPNLPVYVYLHPWFTQDIYVTQSINISACNLATKAFFQETPKTSYFQMV